MAGGTWAASLLPTPPGRNLILTSSFCCFEFEIKLEVSLKKKKKKVIELVAVSCHSRFLSRALGDGGGGPAAPAGISMNERSLWNQQVFLILS